VCSRNQITSLDVTKNNLLTSLICHENQLSSLDITNNPLLKQVVLKNNPGDWWKELEKDEE
jgi:Leucine-rich repeat (LRR) protein